MKKLFGILAIAIAMVCFVQSANAQVTNFNLSMKVAKYIEVKTGAVSFDFGTATHNVYYGAPGNMDLYYPATADLDLAYANCPFSVTVSGQNGANQSVPRFARQEVGAHGGAWDVLNTVYQIGIWTNGEVQNDAFGYQWGFGASSFPKTADFTEAPHNGQVRMTMLAHVNSHWQNDKDAGIPIRETVINRGMTNDQSADYGVYGCSMVVTLAAL